MEHVSRRSVLRAGFLGGGLAATGLAGLSPAQAEEMPDVYEYDLAMLQHTVRLAPLVPYPATVDVDGAFRGWALYMEGNLYGAGVIPGSPGAPTLGWTEWNTAAHVGTWFGWGYLVEDFSRSPSTDPTFLLTSQYVFGAIGPSNFFPPDQLVSSGLEYAHTDQTTHGARQDATQPVTGGAGIFAGANGVVTKSYIGTNTSGPDDGAHSPRNYRLTFDIVTR